MLLVVFNSPIMSLQWNMENEDDKASTPELCQGNFELRTSGGIKYNLRTKIKHNTRCHYGIILMQVTPT